MTIAVYGSVDRIIRMAMEDSGLLEDDTDPTADQFGRYLQRLNDIVNVMQTQGIKLFLLQDIPVTMTAGVNLYTFGPAGTTVMVKPLEVVDAYYSDVNGIRRPLTSLSWNDWDSLSQITSRGGLNSYFADKQTSLFKVYVWNSPDTTAVTGTLHIVFRVQATTYTLITDTIQFPPEWYIFLRWALAYELCTGQPDSIVSRCKENFQYYKEMLESWDVENAPTQMQPDSQSREVSRFV